MTPPKRILLPVDLHASRPALHYAKGLASHFQATLNVLHVLPRWRGQTSRNHAGADQSAKLLMQQRLAQICDEEFEGLAAELVVLEGSPARKIVEFAQSQAIELIVMPTNGRSPFQRFIHGSVTARVLAKANCPVLSGVRWDGEPDFDRILCAVALAPDSAGALRWAAQLAACYSSHLTVFHAVSELEMTPAKHFDPAWRGFYVEVARQEARRMKARLSIDGDVVVETGGAAPAVHLAAERLGAGLLVIGRSPTLFVSGRLPTTAFAIIRESPCPVVSV